MHGKASYLDCLSRPVKHAGRSELALHRCLGRLIRMASELNQAIHSQALRRVRTTMDFRIGCKWNGDGCSELHAHSMDACSLISMLDCSAPEHIWYYSATTTYSVPVMHNSTLHLCNACCSSLAPSTDFATVIGGLGREKQSDCYVG